MTRNGWVALCLVALLSACGKEAPAPGAGIDSPAPVPIDGPVRPLPLQVNVDVLKAELGRRLFLDKRLSHDNSISCAFCHPLERYGADGLPVSTGIRGQHGQVNAPTVYNAGFNFRQFWDGRAATLEEQAGGPIENPGEMGSSWPEVLSKLDKDGDLQSLAKRAFGHRLDETSVREAIATFERSLVTPDSPFDRWLRGDKAALSLEAIEGWRLFRELGCVACHQGINLGGNMYANLGVMAYYFGDRKLDKADLGLFNRTGREEDRYKFKVPSLRNVAMTAPYFHDGEVATLAEAVDVMARTQLGIRLAPPQRAALLAFLNSLTGKLPETAQP